MVLLKGPSGSTGGTRNFECRWTAISVAISLDFAEHAAAIHPLKLLDKFS